MILTKRTLLILSLLVFGSISVCAEDAMDVQKSIKAAGPRSYTGTVFLYGESHGVQIILQKELELWRSHYQAGRRHLFVELPYYTAEFLNLWMREKGDSTFDKIYGEWQGTASHNESVRQFYQALKASCPLTVFHGTDVGHQYDSTGRRYVQYLAGQNLQDSRQHRLALEAIEQGKKYYVNQDDVYRENRMAVNFARELSQVGDSDVVGIYGAAHTGLESLNYAKTVDCMAKQLAKVYAGRVRSQDLSPLAKAIEPSRVDRLTIAGKTYPAPYYGKQDLAGFKNYVSREFWLLEGAYQDFRKKPRNGNVLPYNNFPMIVPLHQVFRIDYVMTDGKMTTEYYVSEGKVWQGMDSTEQVVLP